MNFQDIKSQKKVHFIGIGGIGMSALALILRQYKVAVQGSDLSENYLTPKLRDAGIDYFVGHETKNISDDVSLIVQTSIIKTNNPEILEAQKRNIPIITRANLLAIIMQEYQGITIAGTHGKTSTTGMTSVVLEFGGLDPTVINGGIIHHWNSNFKIGNGKYLVAESDESDASFVDLPTKIGAVTNIEAEHLEFSGYAGSFEKQKEYFERYIKQIPNDGLCVLCIDSFEVEKIYHKLKDQKPNLLTYSIKKDADLVAKNIKCDANGLSFDAEFRNGKKIKNVKIPVYGEHNASNALVAIAISNFLGIGEEKILEALAAFNGVKRRYTKVGEFNGAAIIDDYAHHPTEVSTTLKAARSIVKGKLFCVFQPHKYSRIRDLFSEFCQAFSDADAVIVSDIYSAGQSPIEGINQDSIVAGIQKAGHQNVFNLELDEKSKDHPEIAIAKILRDQVKPGDMVFCCGAGTVTYWAANLEKALKNL